MQELIGKKILYIGQSFFGYEHEIKKMMEKMGADVDYFNERPSNTFLTKVFIRLRLKKIIYLKIQNYYNNILNQIKNTKYDYVFIVKIETIDKQILEKLRMNQKAAKFILYMWDSIENYKDNNEILHHFEKAFSFDSHDTKIHDKLIFLPLFYIPMYSNLDLQEIKYDVCFIGSGHSDRYAIVNKIMDQASKLGLTLYTFFFLQSKKIFIFRKLFDKRMKNANIEEFSFHALKQKEIIDIISKSSVVIDIEHPAQNGLTMRTIEMLGAKKKLITTNKNVKEYDFYHPENIFIMERENPIIDPDFFHIPYRQLDRDIYDKYSLSNWIKNIFEETNIKESKC